MAVGDRRQSAVSKEVPLLNDERFTDTREVFSQEKTAPTADSH